MEGVALLKRTVDELKRVTDNVKPDQLGNSTPCSEWTVRDILNHMAGGGTMFAISAEEGSIPDDVIGKLMTEDQLGDDYKKAVHTAGDRVVAAYERPGVMDKTVTLPFGEMPAGVARRRRLRRGEDRGRRRVSVRPADGLRRPEGLTAAA